MILCLFQVICVLIALGFVFRLLVETFDQWGSRHPVICAVISFIVLAGLASIKCGS